MAEVKRFIVRYVGQQRKVDDALEGELEKDEEDNTGCHDAEDIAAAELKHLIELNEEAVFQLTVNQLYHEWCDQCRFEGKLAEDAEDCSAQEGLAKREATSEEEHY